MDTFAKLLNAKELAGEYCRKGLEKKNSWPTWESWPNWIIFKERSCLPSRWRYFSQVSSIMTRSGEWGKVRCHKWVVNIWFFPDDQGNRPPFCRCCRQDTEPSRAKPVRPFWVLCADCSRERA